MGSRRCYGRVEMGGFISPCRYRVMQRYNSRNVAQTWSTGETSPYRRCDAFPLYGATTTSTRFGHAAADGRTDGGRRRRRCNRGRVYLRAKIWTGYVELDARGTLEVGLRTATGGLARSVGHRHGHVAVRPSLHVSGLDGRDSPGRRPWIEQIG